MLRITNLNEIHSARNTVDIKERVKNLLAARHSDCERRNIRIITYEDLKDDENKYSVSALSIDLVKERIPRNKKAQNMLKETYIVMVNLVVKGLPEIINVDDSIKFSFKKDAILHNLIFPLYMDYLAEVRCKKAKLLDIFPDYYSEGVASDVKDIDKVSLLVMEDLAKESYIVVEPTKEFDLLHTDLILHRLAYFHAVGIALLRKHPKFFDTALAEVNKNLQEHLRKIESTNVAMVLKLLKDNKKLNKYVEKFEAVVKRPYDLNEDTPYKTLIHNNVWKNNVLLKYRMRKDYPTVPRFVKLKNYLFCTQGSSVLDMVQFVFTSSIWTIRNDFISAAYSYLEFLTKYLGVCRYGKQYLQEYTTSSIREELKKYAGIKLCPIISCILTDSEGLDNETIVDSVSSIFYWFDKYGWLE